MYGRLIRPFRLSRIFALVLAAVTLAGLAPTAEAVLSGRNGRIFFTSGRDTGGDAEADIYTVNPIGPFTVEGPFSIPGAGVQNRHASISPDRTQLVFAAGTPGTLATEHYDLYIKDLVGGSVTPLDASEQLDDLSSDHPAWSPDGTRIAYESQPSAGSTDRNVLVKFVNSSADGTPLANSADFEFKAAWSPDSSEIYYATSPTPPPGATQFDIVKKSSTASAATAPTGVLTSATVDEYQPSISPTADRICFTRQSTLGNTGTADVYIADLPGGGNQRDISDNAASGDINCSFSPDGLKVAFSQGTFSSGKLMTENANDSDTNPPVFPIADDPGSDNFDGNADWAPDGSPTCPDINVTTKPNTALTINLECTDTGPDWERTDPNGFSNSSPQNGTLTDESVTTNPSTTKYTPNNGFTGTDTFTYTSFDDFGFGTDPGTVKISVKNPATGGGGGGQTTQPKPKCAGKTATIVGTAGNNVLIGTARADVIVALGGNDRIRAGRGNDIVCAGPGRDKVSGGAGRDRAAGEAGNDSVAGNGGNDRLSGGSGRDRLSGGSGRDRLSGGPGRDKLNGGSGGDRLNGGGAKDKCVGGPGADSNKSC